MQEPPKGGQICAQVRSDGHPPSQSPPDGIMRVLPGGDAGDHLRDEARRGPGPAGGQPRAGIDDGRLPTHAAALGLHGRSGELPLTGRFRPVGYDGPGPAGSADR